MGGAGLRYSVVKFCNYLITKLTTHNLLSVSPISNTLNNLNVSLKADTGASKTFFEIYMSPF